MVTVGRKLGFDSESLGVTTENIISKLENDRDMEIRRSGRIGKGKMAQRFDGYSISSDEF